MKTLISTLIVMGLSIAFIVPSLAGDEPATKAACKKAGKVWDYKTKTCQSAYY
jgi:hypothetical protein